MAADIRDAPHWATARWKRKSAAHTRRVKPRKHEKRKRKALRSQVASLEENDRQVANPTTQCNSRTNDPEAREQGACTPQAYGRKAGSKDAEEGVMETIKR